MDDAWPTTDNDVASSAPNEAGRGDPPRRRFLKVVTASGGALLASFVLPGVGSRPARAAEPGAYAQNAWIRIGTDDIVTIMVAKSEMGQGVQTSMPMIVADELEADWSKVRIETAPANRVYAEPERGTQFTGGSRSVRKSWVQLRTVGASVREMLVSAAARTWQVDVAQCEANSGYVVDRKTGARLSYGALAEKASKMPVPDKPKFKDPSAFKLIGQPLKRLDTPSKTDGSGVYGIDVKLPGMLTACVALPPAFGATVESVDDTKALAVPGVRKVVRIDAGVAVIADGFWQAKRGRDALAIKWSGGPIAGVSSADISRALRDQADKSGLAARHDGDAVAALGRAERRIEAEYEVPYLAHATMEPMTATVHVRIDGVDVWSGTQTQTGTQANVGKLTDVPPEQVYVHTTLLGCGLGRRFEQDFITQATQIAKSVDVPVKLVWTREDDTRHDFYRPATFNRLAAALDADGKLIAWSHRLVGPSIFARAAPTRLGKDGMDAQSIEGAANIPYAIPNLSVDWVRYESGVPVGFWRSVGSSQNGYVTECFMDEIAHAAKRDPVEFRRELLGASPRHLAVLNHAADKAGWFKPARPGVHRGIAVHEAFEGIVAEVVEISIGERGRLKVERVVCAVDCGIVVNPDTVRAQMEGSIVMGLTAALYGEITIKNGAVEQGNFDDYRMVRMDEAPLVEVHLLPSAEPPGGVGEPGVPPLAPALCNAIFSATGKRIRTLPLSRHDLSA